MTLRCVLSFRGLLPAVGVLCAGFALARAHAVQPAPFMDRSIDVYFSPQGGCTDAIVREIEQADRRVRVQVYIFTARPIAGAVIAAHKRGVDCEVLCDKSQERQAYGQLPALKRAGVPIRIDAEHATANNKVILIDDTTVITGSFNYTKAAEEKNAENVLVIKHYPRLFDAYLKNYDSHREHSRAYKR